MSSEVCPTKRKSDAPSGVDSGTRGQQVDPSVSKVDLPKTTENEAPKQPWESTKNIIVSNIVGANTIEINVQEDIMCSVKFLPDGKYVVGVGTEGKIRRWRVADGKEVGKLMSAGGVVWDLAVSPDGKWIVAGTRDGRVTVWNATTHERVTCFRPHSAVVRAVDISPDSTRIATGSFDKMLCVWSLPTGKRLLGPFKHDDYVFEVKFSPDGRLIATATRTVRVYDSHDGGLLAQWPIYVNNRIQNGCLAWRSDGKELLVLSREGDIHCFEVSTWTMLSKWNIRDAHYIALAPNDRFIAASGDSSLSLWDTTSGKQLATLTVPSSLYILPITISRNYDIVVAPGKKVIFRHLLDILPSHYRDNILLEPEPRRPKTENIALGVTVEPLHVRNASQATSLEEINHRLRDQLASSDKDNQSLRAQHESINIQLTETISALADSERKRGDLERTVQRLQCTLHVYEQKHECESMFACGRVYDAAQQLIEIFLTMSEDVQHNHLIMNWLEEITDRCASRLRAIGDDASSAEKHVEAFSAYSTVLSLNPSPPSTVLMGWARMGLLCHSTDELLGGADKIWRALHGRLTWLDCSRAIQFMSAKFHLYRAVCDILEEDDRVTEAIKFFRKMMNELSEETHAFDERPQWEIDFKQRCIKKLEKRADAAEDHDVTIGYYSSALSLEPMNINDIIVKCCQARASLLVDELVSVTKIIEQHPADYKGYKRKHSVLHSMGHYREAFNAFEMMLSTVKNSADPQVYELYLDTTPLIREAVDDTTRDIPRVLIDTVTGRLYDKTQQAAAFEEQPIFDKLRSTMTTHDRLDLTRIKEEVDRFYQYVVFSHRWQPLEPTFQMVEDISIYGLPESPTMAKLLNFCNVVQSRHFRWAWSDTCCVNQADRGVQQESVVAMFRWYCRAALTIVHLLGVLSESQEEGDLWKSIWNTRGWTYQEYVASKVIQFYTEDWKPYLDLQLSNHKESPIILSEMEQATNFSTEKLATIQPGLDRVREKLYLASRRQTTREEDIAYSLFGIFGVALPVIYGEGHQAIGRLLEHVLTRSDNVTILAWTGTSGVHHSYLPSNLTVYDQVLPPHVPQAIETAEMDRMVTGLQSSFPDRSPIVAFYERLLDLPSLFLVSGRLRLPGLIFRLTDFARLAATESDSSLHIYCATASILGEVRIKTKDNSLGMQRLVLVHPWINPLLDEDFTGDDPLFDLDTRALRLLVRLRQPFGALLLASQKRGQYKRVATDSFIQVQIRAQTSLSELMASIGTVDVH